MNCETLQDACTIFNLMFTAFILFNLSYLAFQTDHIYENYQVQPCSLREPEAVWGPVELVNDRPSFQVRVQTLVFANSDLDYKQTMNVTIVYPPAPQWLNPKDRLAVEQWIDNNKGKIVNCYLTQSFHVSTNDNVEAYTENPVHILTWVWAVVVGLAFCIFALFIFWNQISDSNDQTERIYESVSISV